MKRLATLFVIILYFPVLCHASGKNPKDIFYCDREKQGCRVEEEVSIISLIANPDRYVGKRIRTIGYISIHIGSTELFLNCRTSVNERVRVSLGKREDDQYVEKEGEKKYFAFIEKRMDVLQRRYDQKQVVIEGVFEKRMGGMISDLTRLELWEKGRSCVSKKNT